MSALTLGKRFYRAQRGATAVTVTLFMTVIIGMAGFVIDLGHVAYVQRQLQSATDAAALAGAGDLNCCTTSTASATATSYSAVAGYKNAIPGVTTTMVSGYPQLKCFTSTGVSCGGKDAANGIVVKETANVPMWFASIFGLTQIAITAQSTAGQTGGPSESYDIEVVLDTTQSMGTTDGNCSIHNGTRLQCAEAGMQAMLGQFTYSANKIGLMVFPGVTATTAVKDYNCSGQNPTITSYSTTTNYQVLGLGNDFKTQASGNNLNTSSNLVRSTGAGKTSSNGSCPGMQAPGGEGTYYAGAITAAQNDLTTNGRGGTVGKAIFILSDGDATASSTKNPAQITTALGKNECGAAVTAAKAATTAGMKVITMAYGASTSTSGSCATDNGSYSGCSALSAMASTPQDFYSDGNSASGGCKSTNTSVTDIIQAMQAAAKSLGAPRLLPNSTS